MMMTTMTITLMMISMMMMMMMMIKMIGIVVDFMFMLHYLLLLSQRDCRFKPGT